jgi:hypothetical protein
VNPDGATPKTNLRNWIIPIPMTRDRSQKKQKKLLTGFSTSRVTALHHRAQRIAQGDQFLHFPSESGRILNLEKFDPVAEVVSFGFVISIGISHRRTP